MLPVLSYVVALHLEQSAQAVKLCVQSYISETHPEHTGGNVKT